MFNFTRHLFTQLPFSHAYPPMYPDGHEGAEPEHPQDWDTIGEPPTHPGGEEERISRVCWSGVVDNFVIVRSLSTSKAREKIFDGWAAVVGHSVHGPYSKEVQT